ncbi:MAG: M17 family peptidase N-terminal domain-containing protein [Myxococcaceae bacterium]
MSLTTHDISYDGLDELSSVDSLCLFIAEDERPLTGVAGFVDWRLCGVLSRVLRGGFFVGQHNDTLLFPSERRFAVDRIFAVGLGNRSGLTEQGVGEALTTAAQMLNRAQVKGVGLELPGANSLDEKARIRVLQDKFLPAFKGSHVAVLTEKGIARLLNDRGA